MFKAYIFRTEPNRTEKNKTDFLFTPDADKAGYYATKHEADVECTILNRLSVEIASASGERYSCRQFQVEERSVDQWIIFCEVPFWPTMAGPGCKS